MNIYSIVSDSHKGLLDSFFLPSLKSVEPTAQLRIRETEQVCSGLFYSDGWHRAMEFKIDQYIEACKETWGSHFIWADLDIEFYQPFYDYCLSFLNKYDIAFQQSANDDVCAGFFIAKSNESTLNFFTKIKENYHSHQCDQNAINYYKNTINYTRFPNETIWSPLKYWDGGKTNITKEAKLAHANYVVGVQNKTLLLLKTKKDYNIYEELSKEPSQIGIKILSALYGKCSVHENLLDISNILKHKEINPSYLYLFDQDYNIIDVLAGKELE